MMYSRFILIVLFVLLTACQSTGLTNTQRERLRQEQFLPTDEGWELGLSSKILFATDEAKVRPESLKRLVHIGQVLHSIGALPVRLDGHADAVGSDAYNEKLSLRQPTTCLIHSLFI